MNENIPVNNEASVITSFSQSSNSNDIIDLTENNDSDECEVTSSSSVIVSNNSVNSQQPENNSSADDSICILYEKIQPPPDVEVVNEVVISDGNESVNNASQSIQFPPVIMGPYAEHAISQPNPPVNPGISNERTNSSAGSIVFGTVGVPVRVPHHSTLPSCKYAMMCQRPSPVSVITSRPVVALQRLSLPVNQVTFQSRIIANNLPTHNSDQERSNAEYKVPKIQCSICLDGPEEISASGRNFTSTKCGHVFCNECIKTSLKTVSKCPKCRKRVTAKQTHPLYL